MKYLTSILLVSFTCTQSLLAGHILGTDFTYTCNGNNDYTFKLTVYADCSLPVIGIPSYFDNPAYFTVFTGDGNVFETKPNQTYFSVNYNPNNHTVIDKYLTINKRHFFIEPCLYQTGFKI